MRSNRVLYMHRTVHTHAGMQGNSVYKAKNEGALTGFPTLYMEENTKEQVTLAEDSTQLS